MKTAELIGPVLDWAVATCEGYTDVRKNPHRFAAEDELIMTPTRGSYGPVELSEISFSADWAQGGPIIEREGISVMRVYKDWPHTWCAERGEQHFTNAPTPLIAAMRCYVASKLGDEVEVPKELL